MKKKTFALICVIVVLCLTCFSGCGTAEIKDNRTEIVIISDLHLYVDDSYSRTDYKKQMIANFLEMIRTSKTVSELVINGDLMDEWVVPMDYNMPDNVSEFDDMNVENNQSIIDAINAIITDGNIKVTFIPGNHDMTFSEEEAERIFPGINQARDAEGIGTYTVLNGEVAIEHGHRYNFFCAPDPISNRDITGSDSSILPCGYFLTRIAVSSALESSGSANNIPVILQDTINETKAGYYYYNMNWAAILAQLPITESLSDDVIKTNFDDYTDTYSIDDLIPYQDEDGKISVDLYSGIVENWAERQTLNNVNVLIDTETAIMNAGSNDFTDSLPQTEYFDSGSSARIVIFGHTHAAKIDTTENTNGEKVIYANSGSWRDNATDYPLNTYIVITSDAGITKVNIYKYLEDGSSELLQQEEIKN